jgi:predicted SnoaL-like aldol condensation-catalyzing enzyme
VCLEYRVFDSTGSVPSPVVWVIYIEDSECKATLPSVLDYRQHNSSVLDYRQHNSSVLDYRQNNSSVLDYRLHNSSVLDYRQHNSSVLNYRRHNFLMEHWANPLP